jgi:hypothetical protein
MPDKHVMCVEWGENLLDPQKFNYVMQDFVIQVVSLLGLI